MVAPTAPTATTIASQAIYQAGYSTPSSAQKAMAKDHYMEQIKNDIWHLAKELTTLQFETVYSLTEGKAKYQFPTDCSKLITATLLDGRFYGTCQDGGDTGSAVLASDLDIADTDWMLGKEIMIYVTATPTTGYISQCTCWNNTTKVADIGPAWAVSPDADYSYLIVDTYYPLNIEPIWEWDNENYPTSRHRPVALMPLGDETLGGEFMLFQAPDDAYYGLKLRYHLNLMTLDEAGTLYGNLLYRWRNIWIQGIKTLQLEADDDNRAPGERAKYNQLLQALILRERYGMELSELAMSVSD